MERLEPAGRRRRPRGDPPVRGHARRPQAGHDDDHAAVLGLFRRNDKTRAEFFAHIGRPVTGRLSRTAAQPGIDRPMANRTRFYGFRPLAIHVVNPVLRHVAPHLPSFALVRYRGRKSGRCVRDPAQRVPGRRRVGDRADLRLGCRVGEERPRRRGGRDDDARPRGAPRRAGRRRRRGARVPARFPSARSAAWPASPRCCGCERPRAGRGGTRRTLWPWRARTRTGSGTTGSTTIRTSTCSSPRWREPPVGTRRSGCGRGSGRISAWLPVNDCSTWAAASGRQRSRSPRISASAGRSSASTCPSRCCASPVPTPGRARCRVRFTVGDACSLDEPDDSFDVARSERTLQWLADPAAAVAEMVRVVRPGGRVSLIDTDWSTFTIDVGDDALASLVRDADANGAQSTLQRRPATARPRRRRWLRTRSREPRRRRPGRAGTPTSRRPRLVASRWRASPTTSSRTAGCRRPTAGGSCRRSTTRRGEVSSR